MEIHDAMARLEADTRNPRLLSVRRAGQMQHIMYRLNLFVRQPAHAALRWFTFTRWLYLFKVRDRRPRVERFRRR
jgi:hypothetical protein